MNPIEVKQLRKSFGDMQVLCGLELRVTAGGIYGLLGRNGAGKTTLLRTLIGLARPDLGETRVLGRSLATGNPPEKAQVAYVAQGEFLPGWARVKDLARYEAALRPNWDPSALQQWLSAQGISERCKLAKLSVGQRKRLELELALAANATVLLLDEPFAGLDPVSRTEFTEALLARVAEVETTILFSSHIIGDLERVCDRIGILANGVIAFEQSMDELKEQGFDLEELSVRLMRDPESLEAAE